MKVVHLLSHPDQPREFRSVQEVRQVAELAGYEYIQMVNEPWIGEMPTPREANDRPFQLTTAHYGCYKAHKDAIEAHLGDEGLWIFECDAVFTVDHEEAVKRIKRAEEVCDRHPEIVAFTLGYRHNGQGIARPEDGVICINQWIETHSYFVPGSSKPVFDSVFSQPWDTIDYAYTIRLCDHLGAPIAIFDDRPICVQGIGPSLIDGKMKGSEPHFRNVRYHSSQGWKA
jgi:hypothetical protein